MQRYIIRYVLPMLVHVLSTMTPLFRETLVETLTELKRKAAQTPNPIDDIVVGMLLDILDIPDIANSYED